MELTLNKLIDLMLKKIWLIVLIVVISGISAFAISRFAIQPRYKSSITVMILKTDAQLSMSDATLKNNYIEFTKSDFFLDEIEANLELTFEQHGLKEPVKAERIKEYISVNQSNINSLAFDISIVAEDPQLAYSICKEIETGASLIYNQSVNFRGTDVQVINHATLNEKPVSPNVALNTVVGVFLGIILSFLVVILLHMIDNSIKDENDLVDNYELPLLGIVYSNLSDELSGNGDHHE